MTRKSKREIERALEDYEEQENPDETTVVTIAGAGGDPDAEYPDGVGREDIIHTRTEPGHNPDEPLEVEEPLVPIYRPPEFLGGIVFMSYEEIALIYASMPQDVVEKEIEKRVELDEPIPPILQE